MILVIIGVTVAYCKDSHFLLFFFHPKVVFNVHSFTEQKSSHESYLLYNQVVVTYVYSKASKI